MDSLPLKSNVRRIARNVLLVVTLRGLWATFRHPSLLRLLQELVSLDSLRWAVAITGLSLHHVVSRFSGSSLVCGMVCGASVAALHRETRTELTMYLLVRCLHGYLSNLPSLPSFAHYDVLAMSLSPVWLLYAYVYHPETLSPTYRVFLTAAARVDWRTLCGVAKVYAEGTYQTEEAITFGWRHKISTMPMGGDPRHLCGTLLHPNTSCLKHSLWYVPEHLFQFGVPLYLRLKVATTVLLTPQDIVKRPLTTVWKAAKGTTRSALFLALYCASSVVGTCFFSNWVPAKTPFWCWWVSVTCGAGMWTFVEPKGRRLDLALFCTMHVARSLLGFLVKRAWLPRPSSGRVTLLFSLCLAYLYHLVQSGKAHPTLTKAVHLI